MFNRRVITSFIFLPIFLTGIFWKYGDWFTAFIISLSFFFSHAELYSLMLVPRRKTLMIWQNLLSLLFFFCTVNHHVATLILLLYLFYWGSCAITNYKTVDGSRLEIALHSLIIFYVLLPLDCFVYLRTLENGSAYLYFLLAVACFTDIGAYFGGRTFGKHKLAPRISPNKTWEGSFSGSLLSITMIALTAYIQYLYCGKLLWLDGLQNFPELLVVTLVASIIGQIGDLSESAMKRDAGIKDSGSALTGHGGFLDMMDAMLWIAPALLLYVIIRFPLAG